MSQADRTTNLATAGWARPINSRKWHWFAAGSHIAICGRWMYFGERPEPAGDDHPDNCTACRQIKTRQAQTKARPPS